MSAKAKTPAPLAAAAVTESEPVLQDDHDASASESEDTDIGIENEAPVDDATDDSTTSMGDEEDEGDHEASGGPSSSSMAAMAQDAKSATHGAPAAGVPNFKKARARKPSPPKKAKKSDTTGDAPALVSGKRRAAAMAHEIIHATSATGQAEARVASAQARAIAEKKKARKRTATKAVTADQEPPAKKARKSSASTKKTGTAAKAAPTSTKRSATKATPKKKADGETKKPKKTSTKRKADGEPTKKANAPTKKPRASASSTKAVASSSTKTATKKAGKPSTAAKKVTKKAAPSPAKVAPIKRLGLKDAHTKYRARLAVMPVADFAVLDGAWLSVFDPQLRKRATFPEGAFSPKWTQVLAEVAREKGAVIKGVLPHYATTIEGSDNLKAYEKMAHIVDKDRAADYAAAGFNQVEAARVYVGPTVLAAGVSESPFAFLHSDSIDDAFWRSVKKVLDADSSNEDLIDTVIEHGAENAEVDVVA